MTYDVIVVGLGAMGSAALYQLARRGARVIGIDMYQPPHSLGSSHGETRITRQGVGEGNAYVPLVMRSHDIWRELEDLTGERLLVECGFLAIDGAGGSTPLHGRTGFFDRTVEAARMFGIDHQILMVAESRDRFPNFALAGDERIYFEPGGGLVYPERCIAAHLAAAAAAGAAIRSGERVTAVRRRGAGIDVVTDQASYRGERVILAAGPWLPQLVSHTLAPMRLLRQVLHWFEPTAAEDYRAGACPTFMWSHGSASEDAFYGFPIAPDTTPAVKLAIESYVGDLASPEAMARTVGADESTRIYAEQVAGRLAGIKPRAVKAAACLYTFAPDGDFVIDWHPDIDGALIVSACSGHGFKHSAGVGELVALMALEGHDPVPEFTLARSTFAR